MMANIRLDIITCFLLISITTTYGFMNYTTGCGDLQDDENCKPIKMALGLSYIGGNEDVIMVEDIVEPVKPKNADLKEPCDGDLDKAEANRLKKRKFTGRNPGKTVERKAKKSSTIDDEED